MKSLLTILIISVSLLVYGEETVTPDCSCKQIPLHGKVKVVENFADFKVKVVDHFPDLKVKLVEHFPDDCGEWQLVENFPDFTIEYVENFPDFEIQFVDNFPGLP